MPALTEPLTRSQAASLRHLVLTCTATERRRRFAPVLRVGDPSGPWVTHDVGAEALDPALRIEVVAALLLRARDRGPPEPVSAWVCLTRVDELTWQDVDAEWLVAAVAAAAEADLPLTMVVVTRRGWWDPRSDVRREWRRLRQR